MNEHPKTGRHYACAVYVVKDGKLAFLQHAKLHSLLPPGGYVEPGETPQAAALREVEEEVGLLIELVPPRPLQTDGDQAEALVQPWFMQLEKLGNGHEHIDHVFVARVTGESQNDYEDRQEFEWLTAEQILALPSNKIFSDTREMALTILKEFEEREHTENEPK